MACHGVSAVHAGTRQDAPRKAAAKKREGRGRVSDAGRMGWGEAAGRGGCVSGPIAGAVGSRRMGTGDRGEEVACGRWGGVVDLGAIWVDSDCLVRRDRSRRGVPWR